MLFYVPVPYPTLNSPGAIHVFPVRSVFSGENFVVCSLSTKPIPLLCGFVFLITIANVTNQKPSEKTTAHFYFWKSNDER